MIAIISLIVLIGAFLIANSLSRTNAELSNAREQRSMDALRQAKAALIAYAASEQWQLYKGQSTKQPGGLPCPATDASGASAGALCSSIAYRVGLLPWATIGSDDLRDASGEHIWYAVSSNFYKTTANVINSDTQGLLTVTGTAPASNVVAIVFAPGPAIQDSTLPGQIQDRGPANIHRLASYLEGVTAGASDYTFTTNALPSDTFNDRLLVITQADLMSVVEPVVAARIERDVKPYLQAYFNQWGGFPFPAKFANPSPGDNSNAPSSPAQPRAQSLYVGDSTGNSGLLPVNPAVSYAWTTGSVTRTGGAGSINGTPTCALSGTSWLCTFYATGPSCGFNTFCQTNLGIQVEGQVSNAGLSFANAQNFLVSPGSVVVIGANVLSSPPFIPAPTLGLALAATGNGRVLYKATIRYSYFCSFGCGTAGVMVTIPMDPTDPTKLAVSALTSSSTVAVSAASNASPISMITSAAHSFPTGARVTISGVVGNTAANGDWTVTVADATHFTLDGSTGNGNFVASGTPTAGSAAGWLISNEWYRQLYYAVSPAFAPGGGSNCVSTPPCLTVNNLAAPINNKQAILVLAGRVLNGTPRPSASIGDYLEGANQTGSATYVYEHRAGVPTAINDRVVVVAP